MWHAIDSLAGQLRRDGDLTLDQAHADALTQLVLQRADITIHLHATTTEPPTQNQKPTSAQEQRAPAGHQKPVDHLRRASLPTYQPPPGQPSHAHLPDHRRFIGDHPNLSLLDITLARTLELADIHQEDATPAPITRPTRQTRAQPTDLSDPPF